MSYLNSVCVLLNQILGIMAKMAFIFVAYKAIQVMNVYIMRKNKE